MMHDRMHNFKKILCFIKKNVKGFGPSLISAKAVTSNSLEVVRRPPNVPQKNILSTDTGYYLKTYTEMQYKYWRFCSATPMREVWTGVMTNGSIAV
jgi:hypothetical protein